MDASTPCARHLRRGSNRILSALLFLVAALSCAGGARAAVCGATGAACTFDTQCCSRLVCGPARTCQSGCRIERTFVRAGAKDPANPCRVCDPARSTTSYSPAADGSACGTAAVCTLAGSCRAGACLDGPPRSCADGNPCTNDACDPTSGCTHAAVVCEDSNPCTRAACDPDTGRCVAARDPAACDDDNDCTLDVCDPVAGCSHPVLSGACDDKNACTTEDACLAGTCVGGAPPVCEDGNPCTRDACDPAAGCVFDGGPLLEKNRPGAFLVYPEVLASSAAEGAVIKTRVEIKNVSNLSWIAHAAFLNGDQADPQYCDECDFDVPLRAKQTVVLEVERVGSLTRIRNTASGATRWCAYRKGFVTVDLENASHRAVADNALVGWETVSNDTAATTRSIAAIPVQGIRNDGNRRFAFDGLEYKKLPSELHTEFEAPDPGGPVGADLVLFTPNFRRGHPPLTDCSVIGEELPGGSQFSASFQFGCWTSIPLAEIDPEFAYPDLGSERGRIRLRCRVFDASGEAHGGVHGLLVQTDEAGATSSVCLETTGTAGCPVTLRLADPARVFSSP